MTPLSCSFCHRSQRDVRKLIAGPQVHICDACVSICNATLAQQSPPEPRRPGQLAAALEARVIGQLAAKRALIAARLRQDLAIAAGDGLRAPRILLVGPCGSGKTALARALANEAKVGFIGEVATLSESGYVGDDVEHFAHALLRNAGNHPAAERGVICLDGIEKLRAQPPLTSNSRDINGEGAQRELVRLLSGDLLQVSPHGGPRHPQQAGTPLATQRVLVVATFRCERWTLPPGASERALRDLLLQDGLRGVLLSRFDRVIPVPPLGADELAQMVISSSGAFNEGRAVAERGGVSIDLAPAAVAEIVRATTASSTGGWALAALARRMVEEALLSGSRAWRIEPADVQRWLA